MADQSIIEDIGVATIRGQLPAPVIFGDWVMKEREFVVVRLRTRSGHEGWAFTLTRDGVVAEQIRRTIGQTYLGTSLQDRATTFRAVSGSAQSATIWNVEVSATRFGNVATIRAGPRTARHVTSPLLGAETRDRAVSTLEKKTGTPAIG